VTDITDIQGNNKGDRWFITLGSLPLKHNQNPIWWFWRFKVRE